MCAHILFIQRYLRFLLYFSVMATKKMLFWKNMPLKVTKSRAMENVVQQTNTVVLVRCVST